eukprot:Pgem_evm1s3981
MVIDKQQSPVQNSMLKTTNIISDDDYASPSAVPPLPENTKPSIVESQPESDLRGDFEKQPSFSWEGSLTFNLNLL